MIVRCIVVGVALLVAIAGSAWAADGEYFTDARSRCKLWWPTKEPYYNDGKIAATYTILSVKWTGTCTKGMAQGRGTFEVAEKYVYEGEKPRITTSRGEGDFIDGKLTGRGFYVDTYDTEPGTSRTEGEFGDGVLNGKGFTLSESATYKNRFEGQFRDGKANGYAVETTENTYDGHTTWVRKEGEWQDGKMSGRGIFAMGWRGCKSELRYEGEFKNNQPDGRGTLKAYNGKTYTGGWIDGHLGDKLWTWDLSSIKQLEAACP